MKKQDNQTPVVPVAVDATEIKEGMIVKFANPANREENGHYRVRRVTKNTVNLGSVFGKGLYFKGIAKSLVIEDEAAWYAAWQKSDAYQCM